MRIWHVIDASGPQATATTLELLNTSRGRLGRIDERLIMLGGSPLRRAARQAGIHDSTMLGVPFGSAPWGFFAARRRFGHLPRPDILHCWSLGAAALAAMQFRRTPKVITITVPPSTKAVRWLRAITGGTAGRTVLLPISATIHRQLLSAGLPQPAVHVLRPGLDMSRVAHGSRASLREHWSVPPDAKVVALVADPVDGADVMAGILAVGLADEACGGPLSLLAHPMARHSRRAARHMERLGKSYRLILDQRAAQPWLVMPGCDVALAQGTGAGGLSLLWAMCANVPIVAEATIAVGEIVEDRHSALLARPGQQTRLAHRICQICHDQHLSWRLRDTARHEAYSFFSRQRYCQSIKTVYEQMVSGQPVAVPPLEATGGLRFAGRA